MTDSKVEMALSDGLRQVGVDPGSGDLVCPRCASSGDMSCWDEAAERLLVTGKDPAACAEALRCADAGLWEPFADGPLLCYTCEWLGSLSVDVALAAFRIHAALS